MFGSGGNSRAPGAGGPNTHTPGTRPTRTPHGPGSQTPGNQWIGYQGDSGLPAYNPVNADSTVLLAGLMGMRPDRSAALSTDFSTGSTSGMGRRPSLQKRVALGGA
jgi:hypothetical protein